MFVVLLVIGAIIVKSQDKEAAPIFHANDAYMLAGAVLAFILLNRYAKYRQQKLEEKRNELGGKRRK